MTDIDACESERVIGVDDVMMYKWRGHHVWRHKQGGVPAWSCDTLNGA